MQCVDPMEQIIERALVKAGVRFTTDMGGENAHNLDFHLTDYNIAIEVKRFHSDRIYSQMDRHENILVAQGKPAVEMLAKMIEALAVRPDGPTG